MLSAYAVEQHCRPVAGAIEAAATVGTGGGAVTGGAAGGETSTGVGRTGSRQGGAAAGAGGGAAGGGGGAGTRCPDGSIALLGICSGGRLSPNSLSPRLTRARRSCEQALYRNKIRPCFGPG